MLFGIIDGPVSHDGTCFSEETRLRVDRVVHVVFTNVIFQTSVVCVDDPHQVLSTAADCQSLVLTRRGTQRYL